MWQLRLPAVYISCVLYMKHHCGIIIMDYFNKFLLVAEVHGISILLVHDFVSGLFPINTLTLSYMHINKEKPNVSFRLTVAEILWHISPEVMAESASRECMEPSAMATGSMTYFRIFVACMQNGNEKKKVISV